MMSYTQRIRRIGRRWRRSEDGTATVEAVLWFPIFVLIFGLMVDASLVFHGQSKVLRVVQDANRNMSIGRFTTETEVETYITAQLAEFNVTPTTTDATSDGNVVVTVVRLPASQLQVLGLFNALLNLEIGVSSAHILESIDPTALSVMVSAS